MGKRILFSEGHGEIVRFQKSITSNILSSIGGIRSPFETLEQILMKFNYSLHYSGEKKISIDYLRNYDILVSVKPIKPFTPHEISALEKFVQSGGALLILGQYLTPIFTLMPNQIMPAIKGKFWKTYEHLNNITRKFGIFFIADWISPENKQHATQNILYPVMTISHFESHSIFQKIKNFYYQGCSIELTDEAIPLAYTDKDTKPPHAIVMAISQYGEGRAFTTGSSLIFTDNRVQNLGIRNPQHAQLVLNIFTWLSHKKHSEKLSLKPKSSQNKKYCPYCGLENPVAESFCGGCGSSI
ncbi:MAG TPA: hypothetical protein VMV49_14045 [Candidatus Deferrimicrobium sp.]|nr:hypothetical protein [Candidatus Deferrimicrobium sp.]